MLGSGSVEILDSTLRDGTQGEGISFSTVDKMTVARLLDRLGVSYIEAGNPGSNARERDFFVDARSLQLRRAKLVAFGSTARRGSSPSEDRNCQFLLDAQTDCVAIFGKCWDLHVTEILRAALDENLALVKNTMRFFKQAGKEVIFDAEHFFDGFKHNPAYALEVLKAAAAGGADCLVLCDTNGGCFPDEIYTMVQTVVKAFPLRIGIHCHNDGGNGAANSVMAVKAGACHVQGTLIGFGERCGNASLATILPNLQEKLGYNCIPRHCMTRLTETARAIAETANVVLADNTPYVGLSAFAHKGGMHIDGVSKLARSFEHLEPERVGNRRRFLISESAGRGAVLPLLQKYAPKLQKDSKEAAEIAALLKSMEAEGYQYESAEASFELMVRGHLGYRHNFFTLIHYRIINEQDNLCSALVKLRVGDAEDITAADGDGPVNAMDKALRKALEGFYPSLAKMRLIDYKVRVLESGDATAAKVRVLIQSADTTDIWATVGVSVNIIDASWNALCDSIEYKLLKDEGILP